MSLPILIELERNVLLCQRDFYKNRITASKHWKNSSEDLCEISFVLFKQLTKYLDG